ncbi:hypothetical protein V8G54_020247 [Vigna mungo]|uniref:Plastid lipid-associated protein/fibrillin conserved domain-containing protein n=1 Tax=Vigna mungo TaxID=3915 RepID=A0AAQ3RWH9_VIGMU
MSMATLLIPNSFTTKLPGPRYCHRRFTCSSATTQSRSAKEHLLALIADQDRGLRTQSDPFKRAAIVEAIDAMAAVGAGSVTTGQSLSATWRLLWTTEKEQLFIIEKAPLFGTRAGDVLQVIDVQNGTLNNVITFPPDGVFFVRSSIEVASSQRVNFSTWWMPKIELNLAYRASRMPTVRLSGYHDIWPGLLCMSVSQHQGAKKLTTTTNPATCGSIA